MEALDVAHQLLVRDASHRVSKTVDIFRKYMGRNSPLARFANAPHYGVVNSVDELPLFKVSPHQYEADGLGLKPLHYVDGGRVYYFPDSNHGSGNYVESHLFGRTGNTYLPTLMLMRALWDKLQREETGFPEIHGQELVFADDREAELKALAKANYHVRIASYTTENTPVSIGRLRATGFVAEFGFPGEEPRKVNTLEVSASLIRQIEEGEPNSREAVIVDAEDVQFLRGLKERCFLIQKEHGPFAAKYAWETYKMVARYLNSEMIEAS